MNTADPLPQPELRARLSDYLDRLPLPAEERGRLLALALSEADSRSAFAALHRALGQNPALHELPATSSIGARLALTWADRHRRGDEAAAQVVRTDVQGHARLVTTPAIDRSHMSPRPWSTNPFGRGWRKLKQKLFGKRGLMAPDDEVTPDSPDPRGNWRWAASFRRLILVGFIIAQTYIAAYFMTAILPFHGQHWLEKILLVIYAVLFAWVGSGFWTALMGFWVLLWGKDKYSINATAGPDFPIAAETRTAVLMPICNEDVGRVFAGIRATWDSLGRTSHAKQFDFFVLSDSSEADVRVGELSAWNALCREVNGYGRIFYRRRTNRIKRKSGNVADWCRRWGRNYKYMIVLDADSVMSGECLKRLVQLMEANPNAGIIQTAPRASGRETLYARIQQFATRIYGPLFTAGLHFWQLGESHYWGHNAILRVAPFMRHCALGRLPGRGALAGEILSHDFVEAALMRRAGWAVWIAYDLEGSYEEMPPTLLDELKRDRRWCQGNLMNFRLFMTQGLHPAHRAVFMTGVMAYLSAPLWFLFLVLSTALLAVNVLSEPVYFSQPYQLFPNWPEWHPEWAIQLFGATATLLFLPKLLSAVLILCKWRELKFYGGPLRLIGSVFTEVVFSALLAPIRMLFHTKFVTSALLGLAITWKSPPREDAETTWGEALSKHWGGTLLGTVWAGGVYWLNPQFLYWLLPVVGALMLAIPLSVWSSRVRLGRWFRARRFFLFPEESAPPRELRWLTAAMRRTRLLKAGFVEAVIDPIANALTVSYGIQRPNRPVKNVEERQRLVEVALTSGPQALTEAQRNLLLSDPLSLSRLHFRVWALPEVSPQWLRAGQDTVS